MKRIKDFTFWLINTLGLGYFIILLILDVLLISLCVYTVINFCITNLILLIIAILLTSVIDTFLFICYKRYLKNKK